MDLIEVLPLAAPARLTQMPPAAQGWAARYSPELAFAGPYNCGCYDCQAPKRTWDKAQPPSSPQSVAVACAPSAMSVRVTMHHCAMAHHRLFTSAGALVHQFLR